MTKEEEYNNSWMHNFIKQNNDSEISASPTYSCEEYKNKNYLNTEDLNVILKYKKYTITVWYVGVLYDTPSGRITSLDKRHTEYVYCIRDLYLTNFKLKRYKRIKSVILKFKELCAEAKDRRRKLLDKRSAVAIEKRRKVLKKKELTFLKNA